MRTHRNADARHGEDVMTNRSQRSHRPPKGPTALDRKSWWQVLRRTAKEFNDDNLTDWAAALTYYSVLSIFPGLLVIVSLLGLFGQSTIDSVVQDIGGAAPDAVRDVLVNATHSLRNSRDTAGMLAIVGLAGGLWSASNYVGAFMRASNAVYDVPEGRPIWKTLPIRIGVTVVVAVLLTASVLIVVLTGSLAEYVGDLVGFGSTAVTMWNIVKWPVLVVIISQILALLYWATPNAKQAGVRWVSPGGMLAVVLWIAASAGFGFYVANFSSYNKTYGSLAGVVIFLIWLWISNIAVLLGAEFDAELHRGRAIETGHPDDEEPFMDLRDDRALDDDERE
jgi:membrane protein